MASVNVGKLKSEQIIADLQVKFVVQLLYYTSLLTILYKQEDVFLQDTEDHRKCETCRKKKKERKPDNNTKKVFKCTSPS